MNFMQRGFASIRRKPGKTLILLLLIFVLGNVIAGAISIRQAVQNTQKALYQRITAVATIETDQKQIQKFYEQNPEGELKIPNVKADLIKQVGALPYVKFFDFSTTVGLQSKEIKRYMDPTLGDVNYGMGEYQYISCIGGQDPEVFDIRSNKIKLAAGRVFTPEEMENLSYVALVSKEFAEINNLSVGSKVTLDNIIFKSPGEGEFREEDYYSDANIAGKQSYDFEVIGIFELVPTQTQQNDQEKQQQQWNDMEKLNTIYTSNVVTESASKFQMDTWAKIEPEFAQTQEAYEPYYEPLFILNDPQDLKQFREEVSALLPSEYLKVSDTGEMLEKVAAPMESVQWIASIVLYVAVGAALVILSLLITLFLRDRKHEIGIYLSLGEKKLKVVGQIVMEVMVIALVAITLSLVSGNILSGGISQKMIQDQIVADQEQQGMDGGYMYSYSSLDYKGYGISVTTDDIVDSYRVSLDGSTILLFYAVGAATVLLSTMVPILYIVRLNPKKIML